MSHESIRAGRNLEFEVTCRRRPPSAAFGPRCRQQAHNSPQILPGCPIQCWVGAYQVADHVPRCDVERAFRCRPHRQRNRALRTKTNALSRRLLPRPYSHGLREHVYRHRFMSRLEFSVAAKTVQVFHEFSLVTTRSQRKILSPPFRLRKYVERFPSNPQRTPQQPEPNCDLAVPRLIVHSALYGCSA